MQWILIGAAIVLTGASLSLWASFTSRRDVASGRPKFDSVADLTGIWNRKALDEILGDRDAEDRYRAEKTRIRQIPRPAWKIWLDNEWGDLLCMLASVIATASYPFYPITATALLSAALLFVVLGYVCATYVVVRGRDDDEESA